MPRYPFAFSGLALLARLCGAGESADFLLLESPATLQILNRYEQPLAPGEKRELLPFSPLRVVAEQAQLGDGITPAKEVSLDGRPYYLLRGEGAGDPPGVRRYRGCRVLDGREAKAGADIRCATGAKPGGGLRILRKGEAVQPVFSHGGHAYVKIPGAKAEYAWCPAGGPFVGKEKAGGESAGQGTDPQAPGNVLDPELQSRLGARMESANQTYASYAEAFNKLTAQSRPPPRWDCAFSPAGMDCALKGGLQPEDLEKSTLVLAEDLHLNLAGRPFDVTIAKGQLKVSSRTGKNDRGP